MYEAILKEATENSDFKFSVTTSPYPELTYWKEKAEKRRM